MTQVQFGLTLPINNPDLSREVFLTKIRAGLETIVGHFDSVWLSDHLQFGTSPLFEGWTMLTYLAALHPELRYGHLVLCQLFRNPALLAKMAATFQYMSPGAFYSWHRRRLDGGRGKGLSSSLPISRAAGQRTGRTGADYPQAVA